MTDDRYIPGVPCWVDTAQPDARSALDFYGGLLGWRFEEVTPGYHVARLEGGDVAAVAELPDPAEWRTYIWVEDADESAGRVRAAGGTVPIEPTDIGPAGRMAGCADPDGAAFRLWQAGEHRGATVVNEAGSLNFNDLSTSDLAAAEAFYGSVFGWDVLDLGGGRLWTLPGYGDFLERRSPGLRASMAEMGAPERFEDVVASVRTIEGEEPPGWGVTFAVADADATAARATELGGSVVAPPFDAPWVRMTVIADPAGATFAASQFVPENAAMSSPG